MPATDNIEMSRFEKIERKCVGFSNLLSIIINKMTIELPYKSSGLNEYSGERKQMGHLIFLQTITVNRNGKGQSKYPSDPTRILAQLISAIGSQLF